MTAACPASECGHPEQITYMPAVVTSAVLSKNKTTICGTAKVRWFLKNVKST